MIEVVNRYKVVKSPNDILIDRKHSPLGNPFTHLVNRKTNAKFIVSTREEAIEKYRLWLNDNIENKTKEICDELNRIFLMAKDGDVRLVCTCSPKPCHGDVIKEIIESKL